MALVFNTSEFWLFFVAVYLLYLCLRHRWQNYLLLAASYVFYGSWDWRFLSLIWLSTGIDYVIGLKMDQARTQRRRKILLWVSMSSSLLILGFFKYFNFFNDSLVELASVFGWQVDGFTLHVILPVGISFYTFQTMSYTIDIYRRQLKPARKLADFALFVAFFPQLVAGPIERAASLLPQVARPRRLSDRKIVEGMYLIGWGLFKKVVVADSLATLVEPVFAGGPYNGLEVWLALYAFAWQIYGDFSGYTDIARGLAKLMGFELMLNFHLPYFSRNAREFWQRWHISLSTWLKDYLYIPLGGNRHGWWKTQRNLAITMLLGGLWHGAAWTFVVWGGYHGLLLIVHRIAERIWPGKEGSADESKKVWSIVKIIIFFHLVAIGWLFFRARSFGQAGEMLKAMFWSWEVPMGFSNMVFFFAMVLAILVWTQIVQWRRNDLLFWLKLPRMSQLVYGLAVLFVTVYVFMSENAPEIGREFIYFQF